MTVLNPLVSPPASDGFQPPPVDAAPRFAASLRGQALAWGAVAPSLLLGPVHTEAFGVLMYHRITPALAGVAKPTWNVTPRRFASQLRGLLRLGFDPWPLKKVVDFRRRNLVIPRNVFVVTFDDVYANVYQNAFPVLQKLKIPATLFLATAYLDSNEPFPFDDWSAKGAPDVPGSSWLPISTRQCREMQDSGLIELAAHTHTHSDFRDRPDALRNDLHQCVEVMATRFGVERPNFAFPYGCVGLGYVCEELTKAARETGIESALTTESRLVLPEDDTFHWGRFTAESYDTALTLAAKLNGWHNAAAKAGRALRGWCRARRIWPGG